MGRGFEKDRCDVLNFTKLAIIVPTLLMKTGEHFFRIC